MVTEENPEENGSKDSGHEQKHELIEKDMYGRDIHQLIILQDIIDELSKSHTISSIMDVGTGSSAIGILLALKYNSIQKVFGIDSGSAGSPWSDTDKWQDFIGNNIKIHFVESNIFDTATITSHMKRYDIDKFDICFIHQTLHHLRNNDCKYLNKGLCDNSNKKCIMQGCEDAVGEFDSHGIFNHLFNFSNIVIISENYVIGKDEDKENSQGGYLEIPEIEDTFRKILLSQRNLKIYKPINKEYTQNGDRSVEESLKEIMDILRKNSYFVISIH